MKALLEVVELKVMDVITASIEVDDDNNDLPSERDED